MLFSGAKRTKGVSLQKNKKLRKRFEKLVS